jgi:hypothetical protein
MHDPDDLVPATLQAVEADVRRDAIAATRVRLDALVDGALALAEAAPPPPAPVKRAWVFALAATFMVATALAAGVAGWRRPVAPARPRAVVAPQRPVALPTPTPRVVLVVAEEVVDSGQVADEAPPPVVVMRRPRTSAPAVTPVVTAESPGALYRRANEARRGRAHDEAATLYRALIAAHPDALESQQARVSLGRMLLDRGRGAGEAEALFAAYLRREPRGIEAETAMAGRARALHGSRDERTAWEALLRAFPETVHADEARRRVAELGGE